MRTNFAVLWTCACIAACSQPSQQKDHTSHTDFKTKHTPIDGTPDYTCPAGRLCYYIPPTMPRPPHTVGYDIVLASSSGTIQADIVYPTTTETRTLVEGQPQIVAVPSGDPWGLASNYDVAESRGVLVKTTRPLSVVLRESSGPWMDAATIKPSIVSLGKDFRLAGYTLEGTGGNESQSSVQGIDAVSVFAPIETTVTFTKPESASLPYWAGSIDESYSVTLSAGQTYVARTKQSKSIDGARVISTQDIAVLTQGRGWAGCGDDGFDQQIPVNKWAKNYFIPKYLAGGNKRIIVLGSGDAATTVTVTPSSGDPVTVTFSEKPESDTTPIAAASTNTLQSVSFSDRAFSFEPTADYYSISGSNPIGIVQTDGGTNGTCELGLAVLPPLYFAPVAATATSFNVPSGLSGIIKIIGPETGFGSATLQASNESAPTSVCTSVSSIGGGNALCTLNVSAGSRTFRMDGDYHMALLAAGGGTGLFAYYNMFRLPGCGDGVLSTTETCDDGNVGTLDGCTGYCNNETGWNCQNGFGGTSCASVCGDGAVVAGEGCDDGEATVVGCRSDCSVESGYTCSGQGASTVCSVNTSVGPGGLTDAKLWLRADRGIAKAGTHVASWANQGAGAMSTQPTATPSNSIVLIDTGLNYQPSVLFKGDASKVLMGAYASAASAANELILFSAASLDEATGVKNTYSNNPEGAFGMLTFEGQYGVDGNGSYCSASPVHIQKPTLARVFYRNVQAQSEAVTTVDGLSATACTSGNVALPEADFQIGGRTQGGNSSRVWKGPISEVSVFDRLLSSGEVNKVESYMAARYGITLDQTTPRSYVASDGATLMWDAALAGAYKSRITIIGRDESSAFNQRLSQAYAVTSNVGITQPTGIPGLVTMALGRSIPDSNTNSTALFPSSLLFASVADNNADMSAWTSTEQPSADVTRIEREWQWQENNDVGVVTLSVPAPGSSAYTTLPSFPTIDHWDVLFLRSIDSNFASGVSVVPMVRVGNTYQVTVNMDFREHFTFGIRASLCGNGAVDAGESCDDGNLTNGDGCASNCTKENNQACTNHADCYSGVCDTTGSSGVCESSNTCGNGRLESGEACDDGNIDEGDGCASTCKGSNGQTCDIGAACASGSCVENVCVSCVSDETCQPQVCDVLGTGICEPTNLCGNSHVENQEACDDGNLLSSDGCSETCAVEADYFCSSLLSPPCEVINNCNPNPCEHGAVCTDGVNSYSCTCPAGYSGDTCDTNIDDCASNPCQHGGVCTDGVNSYSCTCPAGYSGDTCDTNINDCASNPCQHGGVCTDGVNSYSCTCPAGYSGDTCDTNIDDCASNPCQHGGVCTDGVNSYSCTCPAGYSGDTCDTNIDDCEPNPCENEGVCVDGVNSYSCECAEGYSGDTCSNTPSTNIDANNNANTRTSGCRGCSNGIDSGPWMLFIATWALFRKTRRRIGINPHSA